MELKRVDLQKEEYEEAVLRSLVRPRNMQVSQGGLVYNGFGESGGDNLSQALQMVQTFLEMALVLCIPVILLFSVWDLKTVITLSFCCSPCSSSPSGGSWLDSWLIEIIYSEN